MTLKEMEEALNNIKFESLEQEQDLKELLKVIKGLPIKHLVPRWLIVVQGAMRYLEVEILRLSNNKEA